MLVQDLDTPCAVVDLNVMESNLRRCQAYIDGMGCACGRFLLGGARRIPAPGAWVGGQSKAATARAALPRPRRRRAAPAKPAVAIAIYA